MASPARATAAPLHRGRRSFDHYYLIAPALVLTITILLFPLVYSFYVSFLNYSLARPNDTSFAGITNYVAMATQSGFLGAL